MNTIPSSPPAHRPDPAMDTLLAAAWQSIQQVNNLRVDPTAHSLTQPVVPTAESP